MTTTAVPRTRTVGWPELIAAGVTAVVLYLAGGLGLYLLALPPKPSGLAQLALSAIVPALALAAALFVGRIPLSAFGFRRVRPAWLFVGVGVGLVSMGVASLLSILVLTPLFPDDDTQADYHSAVTGGPASFLGVMLLGGIIEPIGEELLFRGVVASFLRRWGPWVMIIGTTLIFALAHGPNVVFVSAAAMSLGSTYLYWRTGSIWPSLIVHATYNSSSFILQGLGF
ncbi:type II CAAX endopeptidase family protein [Mycolicibacterium sp. 050158]|uniref:CPBP family intramembrane glutamic endopeptidase n=1 Tax=Mycolicibacterium sp. 050158 TaxID=3090602 RepID=UPI00299ED205|nr:type II CAAX endopeptidase family protein [Mycolicibacterium sp. 050158]MDX1892346.1 type II CAAX endopeptidase family protein [Mycolicibacterium sp. 050158]